MLFNLADRLGALVLARQKRLARVHIRVWRRRPLRLRRGGNRLALMRLIRVASAVILLASELLLLPSASAQEGKADEYRAKANFLAVFADFVEWPSAAFSSEQAPLLICVLGEFSFGTTLAEATRGASIRGRRMEIRWARKEQGLRACQILFVSRSESRRYGRIFKAIQGASVLTVGETPDFLASGGTINFLFDANKLQFEVSVAAANDAGLRISSKMLALARHVVSRTEAAKG